LDPLIKSQWRDIDSTRLFSQLRTKARLSRQWVTSGFPTVEHDKPTQCVTPRPALPPQPGCLSRTTAKLLKGASSNIALKEHLPHPVTAYRWLAKHPEFRVAYYYAQLAKFEEKGEELIELADGKVGGDAKDGPNIACLRLMIETRKWIMAKELPRKYGKMAALAPPPPIEPMRPIEDRKTINVQPNNDPIGEAIKNFERAFRERRP
jgi:hypothetical protein